MVHVTTMDMVQGVLQLALQLDTDRFFFALDTHTLLVISTRIPGTYISLPSLAVFPNRVKQAAKDNGAGSSEESGMILKVARNGVSARMKLHT